MFKNTLKRLNHLKKQRLLLSDSSTVIFLSAVFDSLCDTALSVLLLFLMLIKNCRVHCLILQCCRVCVHRLKTLVTLSTVSWNSVHLSSTPTTLISFSLLIRFTEVRTNGNSTWRMGSWIWTGETMSSPKPLGMPNGEEEKKRRKKKHRQSNRSRNSVTPSIQLTDCSISFHILWLDSFQETSSESLTTLTNPKDCEVPYKPGCRQ